MCSCKRRLGNLRGRCEYLLCGHTTITANELFYNRRLSIGAHMLRTLIQGVISGAGSLRPGIILGKQKSESGVPIALIGKVYCKVDATSSPIEIDDPLRTSPTKGHAMKADDPYRAFGSVIGKALGSIKEGLGIIPVLVALQ